jgi:hypothetical protein
LEVGVVKVWMDIWVGVLRCGGVEVGGVEVKRCEGEEVWR